MLYIIITYNSFVLHHFQCSVHEDHDMKLYCMLQANGIKLGPQHQGGGAGGPRTAAADPNRAQGGGGGCC